MELSLNDDQRAILDAIEALVRPYTETPVDARGFTLESEKLDQELSDGGFLDVAFDEDLDTVTAALIVERLARLPYTAEISLSALVRPLFGKLQRPFCIVDQARPTAPVHFLQPGATAICVSTETITMFSATSEDIRPVTHSLYAYPVAKLADRQRSSKALNIDRTALISRWRTAIAVEIAGLLRGALDATVAYVSDRKQFGKPLGTFQAVRHRLADAHSRTVGVKWLALKAAETNIPEDAALAAHFAQDAALRIVYDLHQFLGAMGVTLEHPLHFWTYRLKALTGELGGSLTQAHDAAVLLWD